MHIFYGIFRIPSRGRDLHSGPSADHENRRRRAASQPKRRDHRAVQRAIGLTGADLFAFHCLFARHRPPIASSRPTGIPATSDTKAPRHEISRKHTSCHDKSHRATIQQTHMRSHRRTRQLLFRRMTRFQTMLRFRGCSCCRRPFVFDDATKPERVNTAKRQRAKRA